MNGTYGVNEANAASSSDSLGHPEASLKQLIEGRPRQFDDSYQQDMLEYLRIMRGILRLLSVRNDSEVRGLLLMLPLRIMNRGRVEVFVLRGTIYIDIAFLDLLWLFSFEQGVADVKQDPYHMLEFNLAYAVSLHTRIPLEQLDPYNSAALSEAQFRQLWEDALNVQQIAFESTLAFTLAHEVGHLVLDHKDEAREMFPNPETHRPDNSDWVFWRRQTELAADRFAILLSLDANYQPAHVIPWLDLVEIRRSFYGRSAEYPTPGQRESMIYSVYNERFGGDGIEMNDFPRVDPLPPDRNISQVNRMQNLDNVRRIRTFRRNFLAELDTQVGQLIGQGVDIDLAAEVFIHQVEAYRMLLYGAENPKAIEEALSLIDTAEKVDQEFTEDLRVLFEQAFSMPEPVNLLSADLEVEPIDFEKLRQLLEWAKEGFPIFADALELKYLMANTRFRWEPLVFQKMLNQIPESSRIHLHLAPYHPGEPIRPRHLTTEERIEVLKRWNGSYVEANKATFSMPAKDKVTS